MPVPLSLHEAVLERLHTSEPRTGRRVPDPDLDAAVGAMGQARMAAEQAGRLADALRADPTRTPAAAVVELHRVVPPIAERATRALDTAATRLRRTVSELEASMEPPGPSNPEALAVAGEIRKAVAGAKDRNAMLSTALEEEDTRVIGAVLRAPGVVSGLTAVAQKDLRRRWQSLHHPETYGRTQRLGKALNAIDHAAASLLNFTRALVTPPGASELLAAAQAAEAMRRAAEGTK